MWEKVASRLHTPIKIFPFGENADEVMLFGTVAYTLKDGRKANVSTYLLFLLISTLNDRWTVAWWDS
jgi:hypothetical protein